MNLWPWPWIFKFNCWKSCITGKGLRILQIGLHCPLSFPKEKKGDYGMVSVRPSLRLAHNLATTGPIHYKSSSLELSQPLDVHCHDHLPMGAWWLCPWAWAFWSFAHQGLMGVILSALGTLFTGWGSSSDLLVMIMRSSEMIDIWYCIYLIIFFLWISEKRTWFWEASESVATQWAGGHNEQLHVGTTHGLPSQSLSWNCWRVQTHHRTYCCQLKPRITT